jgi:hypothetical protein
VQVQIKFLSLTTLIIHPKYNMATLYFKPLLPYQTWYPTRSTWSRCNIKHYASYVTFETQRTSNMMVDLRSYILSFAIKRDILRAEPILFDDNRCECVTVTKQRETFVITLHCTTKGNLHVHNYFRRWLVNTCLHCKLNSDSQPK